MIEDYILSQGYMKDGEYVEIDDFMIYDKLLEIEKKLDKLLNKKGIE